MSAATPQPLLNPLRTKPMAQTFPTFTDGKVEIWLTADEKNDKLVLHAHTLALHSTWFKASLSERWSTSGTAAGTGAGTGLFGNEKQEKARWAYELRFEKDSADGFLLRKGIATDAEFLPHCKGLPTRADPEKDRLKDRLKDVRLKHARDDNARAHKDMLGALYHLPPAFSTAKTFGQARVPIGKLQDVAAMYGCEDVVKLHIENALRSHSTKILYLCTSEPVEMVALAVKVKCDWMFMEASTNLLGRSKRFFDAAVPTLKELGIYELLSGKRKLFIDELRECDIKLFSLQPAPAPRTEDGWAQQMAITYFRHWLAARRDRGEGSGLAPGYAVLYNSLRGWRAKHNQVLILKTLGPLLMKGRLLDRDGKDDGGEEKVAPGERRMLEEVDAVFGRAAAVAAGVLKDTTRRREGRGVVHRSLRCMEVREAELPWVSRSG